MPLHAPPAPAGDDLPSPAPADTGPERRSAAGRPPSAGQSALLAALRHAARPLSGTPVDRVRRALGLVVLAGLGVTVGGIALFAWVAARVTGGRTQAVDDAVLRWIGAHRIGWVEALAVEVTFLGTATVVLVLAGVAGLFLVLLGRRTAAVLLGWSTAGAVVLNNVLKLAFDRPRPQLFDWGTHAHTTSFPSGHAMSSAAVYGTVAYLAARLARRRWARATIYACAVVVITLVCLSRLYLGVHYPSDVVAGALLGVAWAAFCTAALEAAGRLARRRAGDHSPAHASGPIAAPDASPGDRHATTSTAAAEATAATAPAGQPAARTQPSNSRS